MAAVVVRESGGWKRRFGDVVMSLDLVAEELMWASQDHGVSLKEIRRKKSDGWEQTVVSPRFPAGQRRKRFLLLRGEERHLRYP